MNLDEIKHIVSIAGKYNLNDPYQMDEFYAKAYKPVLKAVAENDKTVIDYLLSCTKEERHELYTAVEAGAIKGKHPEAIALYKMICEEQGYKIDSRIEDAPDAARLNAFGRNKGDKLIVIECRDKQGGIQALLEYIKRTANIGHSFLVVVDPDNPDYKKDFYIDGDGPDFFYSISVEEKNTGGEE